MQNMKESVKPGVLISVQHHKSVSLYVCVERSLRVFSVGMLECLKIPTGVLGLCGYDTETVCRCLQQYTATHAV